MEKLMKEILCKNPISLTSVLGVACHSSRSYQELIRNRGFKRDRKQHTGVLLLNIPWQFPLFYYICKKRSWPFELFSFNNFCRKATVNNKYNCQDNRQSYSSRPMLWVMLWNHPHGSSPDNWSASCSAKISRLVDEGRLLKKISKISLCSRMR